MSFCEKCARVVGENASFCPTCGKKIEKPTAGSKVETNPTVQVNPAIEVSPTIEISPTISVSPKIDIDTDKFVCKTCAGTFVLTRKSRYQCFNSECRKVICEDCHEDNLYCLDCQIQQELEEARQVLEEAQQELEEEEAARIQQKQQTIGGLFATLFFAASVPVAYFAARALQPHFLAKLQEEQAKSGKAMDVGSASWIYAVLVAVLAAAIITFVGYRIGRSVAENRT